MKLSAKSLGDHGVSLFLSLVAACVLQQPASALADASSGSSISSSPAASSTASRTVVDVVSAETSVLNEGNTPDDRAGSIQKSKEEEQETNLSGGIKEVSLGSWLANTLCALVQQHQHPLHLAAVPSCGKLD